MLKTGNRLGLSRESYLRDAGRSQTGDSEQAAIFRVGGGAKPDGGYEQRVESRPAEHRLGRHLDRHLDDPVYHARGSQPHQLSAADTCHPVAAIGIDRAAIRPAPHFARIEEDLRRMGRAGVKFVPCLSG